jgi:hypothetical protein
MDSAVHTD